ncbi:MAG: DUF4411 family protein [gamma proteobacterium symbiont of Bathyaustriella thionipta]|nr:DUF4411 family protein [gamma proteobacterium symbiont of Bathyaustriella thionipta]
MSYLLDANVFMAANNLHYGLDFCPAFWDWLIRENASQKIFSIEKVGDEIEAGGDELSDWAREKGGPLFLKPDTLVLQAMSEVSQWVTGNGYTPAAINTFLQVADYWLVSYALAHGQVVVTHEKPANTANKVKIPNVCVGLGIKVMTPFEMLRHERARFVLGRR